MNFAVFDPASNRNLAVRNQIPLKLCYAMTIHKAQGMTLDRVEVDCRQMFQPGQLAVAMGRVKSPDGLRVVHFSEDAVIPQSPLVITFLQTDAVAVKSNLSCCHYRINEQVNETKDQLTKDCLISQPAECDIDILSEFDPETDALLAEIDIENIPQYPVLTLPDDFAIEEEIQSLIFKEPVRESQVHHNYWIQYLLENKEKLVAFCADQYSCIYTLYEQCMEDKKSSKSQTLFFQAFQTHITSAAYKSSVLNLMPKTDDVAVVFHLAFDIMSIIRKFIMQKVSESLPVGGFTKDISFRHVDDDLSDTAKGKVRYIGILVDILLESFYIKTTLLFKDVYTRLKGTKLNSMKMLNDP